MKHFKFYFFIGLVFILSACSNNDLIVGNWVLDGVDIEKALAKFPDEKQKEFTRNSMKAAFEQLRGKMKLDFTKDGKFSIETPMMGGKTNVQSGTWKFDDAKKNLITLVEGKQETITIFELTEKRLVLAIESPDQSQFEMTFVK